MLYCLSVRSDSTSLSLFFFVLYFISSKGFLSGDREKNEQCHICYDALFCDVFRV